MVGILLIYLSTYLKQETVKKPFRSSSQAATCSYQSNHSKKRHSVKCLAYGYENDPTGLSSHYNIDAELQARKL